MDIYPFQISDPAVGDTFVGRKAYIKRLKSLLLSPQCPAVSIYGLARIGKSSIVRELERQITEERPGEFFFIKATVSKFETYFKMWRSILNDMKRVFKRNGFDAEDFLEELKELEAEDVDTALELLELGLETAQDNDFEFILVFEEFDAAKTLFEGKSSRFQHLRETKGAQNKLPMLFVSRESVNNIEVVACGTSLLYLSLQPVNIRPFDDQDMQEFYARLEKFALVLNDEERTRLQYYAGCFPFFLANVGNRLVEQKQDGKPVDVNTAFKECELLFQGVYESVLNHLKNEKLYEPFLQVFVGPKYDLKEKDLDEMRARGYLLTDEDENNRIVSCYTLSQWFRDYLLKDKTLGNNSTWLLLSDAELILRKIIRFVYDAKYKEKGFYVMLADVVSNDWISLKKIGFGTDERGNVYFSFMNANIKENNDADILKAASIKDLLNIFEYYWTTGFNFKQYFANDDFEIWRRKLILLDRARIPFAHNNFEFLKTSDIQGVQVYANEIKEINERFHFPETGPIRPDAYIFERGVLTINAGGLPQAESAVWDEKEVPIPKDSIQLMEQINSCDKNGIYGRIKGRECFCHKKYLKGNLATYLNGQIEVRVLSFNNQYGRFMVAPVEPEEK